MEIDGKLCCSTHFACIPEASPWSHLGAIIVVSPPTFQAKASSTRVFRNMWAL